LGDALGLVVMDPVRGAGQALDAVDSGHVVAVGLGECRDRRRLPVFSEADAAVGRRIRRLVGGRL